MTKTAFLFPGQGSQSVGMGFDLFEEYAFVRELFEMAGDIAKINLSKLCFQGPMEDLTQTVNLQPAVTIVNLALMTAIQKEGITTDFTAGHSLGEYSALTTANVISVEDTIRLVFKRGQLMHRESVRYKGAMHAVIGLPIDVVGDLVSTVGKNHVVSVANHNAELQIVTTGAPEAVEKVSDLAKEKGARAIPLKVSGAWHSELMRGAEDEFRQFLGTFAFAKPQNTVLHNVTADMLADPDEIREIMARQLCSPVRWFDTVRKMMEEQVETFVEIGPGKVLTGLLRKILPADYPCNIYTVNNLKALDEFIRAST